MSEEIDKAMEIQHVKQALKANNYLDWMLTTPNTRTGSRVSDESVNEKRIYASVPSRGGGGGGGGGGTPYGGLYGEAPPERGTFFQASGI